MKDPLVVLIGDAREQLKTLDSGSVHCCVTSPPYYGLRDYGVDGQIGLEASPQDYVDAMVGVFREVRRVLRDDGTLWLNLGDSYAASGRGMNADGSTGKNGAKQQTNKGSNLDFHDRLVDAEAIGRFWKSPPPGLKCKDLLGIPWMVAFALRADGWYLRSEIIWAKPNPMPESVTDRPTKSHEQIFLLTKSARYFYDAEAIKEGFADERMGNPGRYTRTTQASKGANNDRQDLGFLNNGAGWNENGTATSRNKRSVWTIATSPYSDAHFATFPPKLVEPCILAGTSARGCCAVCGAPLERIVERNDNRQSWNGSRFDDGKNLEIHPNVGRREDAKTNTSGSTANRLALLRQQSRENGGEYVGVTHTIGWQPTCNHSGEPMPCTVLDPFAGSGTTGKVALEYGRKAILIELNPKYGEMIQKRSAVTMGLPGLA